ncbi:MAG: phage terminase large subunit [Rhodobacteraceae bacterium]|nr:phage terminase large subunit [Paracoccaceae bacterium]
MIEPKVVPLIEYIKIRAEETRISFDVRPHHVIAARALEQALTGTLPGGRRHLVLCFPPRFSKTTMVQCAMEWGTGYIPDSEWIYSSAASERAVKSVSECRGVMRQDWYQELFPFVRLLKTGGTDGRADNFATDAGGSFYGVGSAGQIIGFGAGKKRDTPGGAFIWDDPLKAKDGRSPKMLKNASEFFKETIQTRFNSPTTPLILIMQRIHPDDPVAMLLRDYPDDVHLVNIRAIKDDGTAEWEATKSRAELETMKAVDPHTYYTQYQQEPRTPGGSLIKDEWWQYYTDKEEVLGLCDFVMIFADTASKKNPKNDHSVIQVWGFEGGKRAYLLEQKRGKWEFPDLVPEAKSVWDKWSAWDSKIPLRGFYIEDKSSGIGLIQTLQREGIDARAWVPTDYETDADKVARVKDSAYLIYAGKVWLPDPDQRGNAWVSDFVNEASAFTADDSHISDDQVDTMTMGVLTWKDLGGGM